MYTCIVYMYTVLVGVKEKVYCTNKHKFMLTFTSLYYKPYMYTLSSILPGLVSVLVHVF